MLLVPDEGEGQMMEQLRSLWNSTSLIVGLFVSAHTPVNTDVLADYEAIEATFPGYARSDPVPWGAPDTDGAGRARTTSDDVLIFMRVANGAPEKAFGYFVIDVASNLLMWAEEFAVPFVIDDETADPILVRPRITLRHEPP